MAMIEASEVYTDVALILLIVNSAVNPILYGLFKQDFRSKLKKIFTRREDTSMIQNRTVQPSVRTARSGTLEVQLNAAHNGSHVSVHSGQQAVEVRTERP